MSEVELELEDYLYVEDSHIHGLGLFARTEIEKGEYLGEYDGPHIENDADNDSHVLWAEMDDGRWIGRDGQNILRYLNHSTTPCCEFEGFELYAIRDIAPGEELTIDYGEDPVGEDA